MEAMENHVDKNIEDDMGSGIIEGIIGMNISQIIDGHEFQLGEILGTCQGYHRNPMSTLTGPLASLIWTVTQNPITLQTGVRWGPWEKKL